MTTPDLRVAPYAVAHETFVIPWLLEAPPVGLIAVNSMVIRGEQPILVDTGAPGDREQWFEHVGSLVDLADVRWIFLSHDDRDHSGNLVPLLDACPNATLLTTWFQIGRMAEEWDTPLPRCRFVNAGDEVDVGDRRLVTMVPPVFDNPTTRSIFDPATGVLWGCDAFATFTQAPVVDARDMGDDEFEDGEALGAGLVAPWHVWLDTAKFLAHVDSIHGLPIEVIASCHAPAIRGERIGQAFDALRRLPMAPAWAPFTHRDLEMWLSAE